MGRLLYPTQLGPTTNFSVPGCSIHFIPRILRIVRNTVLYAGSEGIEIRAEVEETEKRWSKSAMMSILSELTNR
jgi:hypothetical protein